MHKNSLPLRLLVAAIMLLLGAPQISSANPVTHFNVLPLGTSGGELEDNLSAYLVAPVYSNDWAALDAGTLCSSINKIPSKTFKKLNIMPRAGETRAQTFLANDVKAYLISHAHLDHINGLVMCSPVDSNKEILGINSTIDYLRDYIFNWKIWPNFADEGQKPWIKKYHYQRLALGTSVPIANTNMRVTPFALNHGNGYPSTAFLLQANDYYLLYFGDTGADAVEHDQDIALIWNIIAPLIRAHKLNTIFIEVSYPNSRPDDQLYGHLTPHLLQIELHALAKLVNPQQPQLALQELNIIVTHIKQGLENQVQAQQILQQLNQENDLGVRFVVPKQNHAFSTT